MAKPDESKIWVKEYLSNKSDEFNFIFKEFRKMRNKIRKPMTDFAEKRLLIRLKSLSENDKTQIEIMLQSIDGPWSNVYPLKKKGFENY